MFSVDREIDCRVTIALRFMFIFVLFFYLPMVSVFSCCALDLQGASRFYAAVAVCLVARVLFVIFHEVKILLFSVAFSIQVLKIRPGSGPNWFRFFMFPEEE